LVQKGIEQMVTVTRFEFAAGLWKRMKGLLDPAVCGAGEVLVLVPCGSVHSFGMRAPIDVAFLDGQGRVLKAVRGLAPLRVLFCRGAVCTLERRSGGEEPWFEAGESVGLTTRRGKGER
jgi:uncharacterized membrane protein (UPF0127 family)